MARKKRIEIKPQVQEKPQVQPAEEAKGVKSLFLTLDYKDPPPILS